ncbi:MAG TPA: hypothetical protein VNF47_18155 [Streptosporangiaceae bacterium]|nr:hypothetical protein [Streptosporangiaceae bacterium]
MASEGHDNIYAAAAPYRLAGFDLLTSLRGYGQFVAERGAACRAGVGSTSDGGARFSAPVQVVSWNCADSQPAGTLAFDGQGDGFLYGHGLFVSHDGGRSWAVSRPSGQVLAIAPSGRSVWMLARC